MINYRYNSKLNNILKLAYLELEKGNFAKADRLFEKAIIQQNDCAEAYLGKIMINLKIRTKKELSHSIADVLNDSNFEFVLKYVDSNFKLELSKLGFNIMDDLEDLEESENIEDVEDIADVADAPFAKKSESCDEITDIPESESITKASRPLDLSSRMASSVKQSSFKRGSCPKRVQVETIETLKDDGEYSIEVLKEQIIIQENMIESLEKEIEFQRKKLEEQEKELKKCKTKGKKK